MNRDESEKKKRSTQEFIQVQWCYYETSHVSSRPFSSVSTRIKQTRGRKGVKTLAWTQLLCFSSPVFSRANLQQWSFLTQSYLTHQPLPLFIRWAFWYLDQPLWSPKEPTFKSQCPWPNKIICINFTKVQNRNWALASFLWSCLEVLQLELAFGCTFLFITCSSSQSPPEQWWSNLTALKFWRERAQFF